MQKVELTFGYESQNGIAHKSVVMSKRPTGAALFKFADESDGQGQVQFQLMMIQAAITSFGTLTMPVPMSVLLTLNSVDRRDLSEAYDKFLKATAEGRKAEKISTDTFRLAFGFSRGGQIFDCVQFGKLLTGYDEMNIEEAGHEGWKKQCALLGQQIVRLFQTEGKASIEGEVGLEMFESLDASDIFSLMPFCTQWQNSFRHKRGEVQVDGSAGSNLPDATPAPAGE